MSSPSERVDPSQCPLCGGPNGCALALPEAEQPAVCWCVERTFPQELLERAPADVCVCRACLETDPKKH